MHGGRSSSPRLITATVAGQQTHGPRSDLFPRPDGRPLEPDSLSRESRLAAAAAGRPHLRVQDRRHAHASLLLADREPLGDVSRRIGHSAAQVAARVHEHFVPGAQTATAACSRRLLEKVKSMAGRGRQKEARCGEVASTVSGSQVGGTVAAAVRALRRRHGAGMNRVAGPEVSVPGRSARVGHVSHLQVFHDVTTRTRVGGRWRPSQADVPGVAGGPLASQG